MRHATLGNDATASARDASAEPVRYVSGRLDGGLLLLCDHASNAIPAEYGSLGLPETEFKRHIAYDIGAAWTTGALAAALEAPALMTTFSRLLIDPNRGTDDPTLVMRLSDGAVVPGNARIDQAEIEKRRLSYWQPYHDHIETTLDAMTAAGVLPAVISVHSFTPSWKGAARPWHVGLLWDNDRRLPQPLFQALAAEPDLQPWPERVGDNEPYDGALPGDTMDSHATRRGLSNVLIEIRQDLIASEEQARHWGERLARILEPILLRPELHRREFPTTRGGGERRLDGT